MIAQYRCDTSRRRRAVRDASPARLNGIDYVEVGADQRVLSVVFLHPLPGSGDAAVPAGPALTGENVVVDGGVRIRNVRPTAVTAQDATLTVVVDRAGDFSSYTLRLRRSAFDDAPPEGFDPQLSAVTLSFRVNCPQDFDCADGDAVPPARGTTPGAPLQIDYLAKDYDSFRRLMLDRMTALSPGWTERNPADGHVALVELLAYVADRLSYHQDAVATEAYLGTARTRVAVRRHARLLDYAMHPGCNARAFVAVEIEPGSDADGHVLPAGTPLETLGDTPEVFEAMHELELRAAHDRLAFHMWTEGQCRLPAGATAATVRGGEGVALAPGDLLLLEEVADPQTGVAADADPLHRHVVRLVTAVAGTDPLDGTPIVDVVWSAEDALAFDLTISALVVGPDGRRELAECAVARGNVLVADHGRSLPEEPLVPDRAEQGRPYRPRLAHAPLTHRAPFDAAAPAATALAGDPRAAVPALRVEGEGRTWTPRPDLLDGDRFAADFVVELESEGGARLRFGDGEHGHRPQPGAAFRAAYRIGHGRAGNVGAGAIARAGVSFTGLRRVRNPLPAAGGTDPEDLDAVRAQAPEAFRMQERAVTEADYAELAGRLPGVQRAAATLRWTGSWHTAFVTVDRLGGGALEPAEAQALRASLNRARIAGRDVRLAPPVMIPLDIALEVCVRPGSFRSDVAHALLERLSSAVLPDGGPGFFHPDRFTFGQPVHLGTLYAAVMQVPGVRWVSATRFQRWGRVAAGELERGVLQPAPSEVVRLDNDPNFPENGRLEIHAVGGM